MQHVTCQHRGCSYAASYIIIYTARHSTKNLQHGTKHILIGFTYQGPLRVLAYGGARLLIDHLQLANGLSMPTIHLGVYLTSGKETYQAVRWALEVYFLLFLGCILCADHVDTGSLDIVGKAIVFTPALYDH